MGPAKAIQTIFGGCACRYFDGTTATLPTSSSQAFIWCNFQPSTLNERLGAAYSDNAIQTLRELQNQTFGFRFLLFELLRLGSSSYSDNQVVDPLATV